MQKTYYLGVSQPCNYLIAHPGLSSLYIIQFNLYSTYHHFIPFSVFSLLLLLSHLMCGTNAALSSTSIVGVLVLLQ